MNALLEDEYFRVLIRYYEKSLILEDPSDFQPVLWFHYMDALAHLEYTLNTFAFNYQSPKNMMSREYMRYRLDEEKKDERPLFPGFINWLKKEKPEKFESLPMLWRLIHDEENVASYRSFRIALDPSSMRPIPAPFFRDAVEEFFAPALLKSMYNGASLATLFEEYKQSIA
ncbi:hypothetical protein [Methanofollis fontis]|uniref:Uncharacterized protein n=1 Tax=Methanofollis fontis TaxID=2052832 RepID=A0A483CTF9_9EURY|nr:hypothetical protein [Methanofollis fontis]TAJ44643.1 hypothetical protein CUJ86_04880 [Methanofollis fontis]